jgi:hypothetical protein
MYIYQIYTSQFVTYEDALRQAVTDLSSYCYSNNESSAAKPNCETKKELRWIDIDFQNDVDNISYIDKMKKLDNLLFQLSNTLENGSCMMVMTQGDLEPMKYLAACKQR